MLFSADKQNITVVEEATVDFIFAAARWYRTGIIQLVARYRHSLTVGATLSGLGVAADDDAILYKARQKEGRLPRRQPLFAAPPSVIRPPLRFHLAAKMIPQAGGGHINRTQASCRAIHDRCIRWRHGA